jgi:serine/threonine protein kinase
MTPSEWDRVAQLFAELRGADDAARRRQLGVDDDGSADPVIVEVRRLLRHHDNATAAFLEAPCPDLAGKLERHVADELVRITTGDPVDSENDRLVGERIGAYTIERLLASGGMGAVYLARQSNPSRRVALKLMRHGLGSRAALRRFETESEILGRMQHPGIAQVYEAGTHRDRDAGVPFFAMEYVEGGRPITDFANHRKLGTRERIQLFVTVCEAVHHGHVKGVVHRDLKPTNILVDAAGRTKVIDFGVARATDVDIAATTLRTDIGQLIGTPRYMSPEQCDADPARIDARCDVYSLGVVLYELLCGRLPYASEGKPTHDLIRSIREDPPTRLGSHSSRLRGDVETIVMKALEKAPERRYASAQALADDLERYLRGEAIQARPPSAIYQLRSIARRHRAIFAATTTILATLLAGSVAVSALLVRESGARRTAEDALRERDAALEASKRSLARVQSTHAFLQRLLGTADPQQGGREGTLVVDAMEFGLVELEAGLLSDQPDARIELLRTIAAAIANNGRPQRGEEIVRRALTEAKALGVEGRALRSRCLNDLGILLSHLGDSDGALAALQEAALLAEEDTPAGSAALADTLYRLAMVHHTADRESLAVDALIRAEHMTSVHGFPSDTFALQCAMLRASIQLRQGDLRAAIGTLEAARDALPAVLRTRPATPTSTTGISLSPRRRIASRWRRPTRSARVTIPIGPALASGTRASCASLADHKRRSRRLTPL